MKEEFEKIIERLEEEREWSSTHGKDVKFREGRLSGLRTGMRIVKEVAEECKSLPVEQKSLTEKFNDGWIPCSEKLPYDDENIKRYIVQLENGRIDVLGFVKDAYKYQPLDFYEYKGKHKPIFYDYDPEYGCVENDDVIAWQPLPAPYKPKGEK